MDQLNPASNDQTESNNFLQQVLGKNVGKKHEDLHST